MSETREYIVRCRTPHAKQFEFIHHPAKRKVIRAGRRSGKTIGVAYKAIMEYLAKKRVLYAAPTIEQLDSFWFEVTKALSETILGGLYKKNENERTIEVVGTKNRIKAKTAWNPDTLRGDYADLLILDEYQLMDEATWEEAGIPTLLDHDGDAIFIYTPPSLRSGGMSKARDPRHAAKMYVAAQNDKSGRYATFHFTSFDNPYISQTALREIVKDMTRTAYRQEILAEDDELQINRLVYGVWNEADCRIYRFPIPEHWPRFVGHDFGGSNPAALFFAQNPETGYFFAYQEYLPGKALPTYIHVEEFKKIVGKANVLKRIGGSHQEEEIRQGYGAHGWPIREPNINSVLAQIERVHTLMERGKLFVFNDLVNYLDELANCTWELGSDGKNTKKIHNEHQYHLSACARYVLSDFTPETVYSTLSKPISYMQLR